MSATLYRAVHLIITPTRWMLAHLIATNLAGASIYGTSWTFRRRHLALAFARRKHLAILREIDERAL